MGDVIKNKGGRPGKLESLGEEAMVKALELYGEGKSYRYIAEEITNDFNPPSDLSIMNVKHFLSSRKDIQNVYLERRKKMSRLKMDLVIDKEGELAEDFLKLKRAQERLEEETPESSDQEVRRDKALAEITESKANLVKKYKSMMSEGISEAKQVNILNVFGDKGSEMFKELTGNLNLKIPEKKVKEEVVDEDSERDSN